MRRRQRIALDDRTVFRGPVRGFVDICLWISRDVDAAADLAPLLAQHTGASIGVYRSAFGAHEQFGVGRHPTRGLHRTRDFSFSLLIAPIAIAHPRP